MAALSSKNVFEKTCSEYLRHSNTFFDIEKFVSFYGISSRVIRASGVILNAITVKVNAFKNEQLHKFIRFNFLNLIFFVFGHDIESFNYNIKLDRRLRFNDNFVKRSRRWRSEISIFRYTL